MKKDKRLQQLADASLENFEDKAFKQELLQRQSAVKPKKLSGRTVAWLSSAACAVVAIVVTAVLLSVYLRPIQNNNLDDATYLFENIIAQTAQIDELNEVTKGIKFAQKDYNEIKNLIDQESNESVYFYLTLINDDGFYKFNIVTIVDKRYKYPSENNFSLDVLTNVAEVKGYTVNYLPTCVQNDMLYYHTVRGVITTETEKVYVQFEQTTIGESNDFLELLAQLIV